MKVQLISEYKGYNAKTTVLTNRGMDIDIVPSYLNSTIANNVYSPNEFGKELMYAGAKMLITHIQQQDKVFVIQDCDVDGMTSASMLINYLYDIFPSWVTSKLYWGYHEGKEHGLNDWIDTLLTMPDPPQLVICPDSGTGDIEEVAKLRERGIDVLILDHHYFKNVADTIIINSQYDYPNKQLSGAGVVWQFCRFLDSLIGTDYASNYIDLAAVGLQSDMMELTSTETKTIVFEGLKDNNIVNPLFRKIVDDNYYSFHQKDDYKPSYDNELYVTPIAVSFFFTPSLNAICRSGTAEEKDLIFSAMLKFKAFNIVPSTKRGHKPGEMERILDQAARTLTNVKNRQDRIVKATMEVFEQRIQNEKLLNHKVILLLVEPGTVDRNVAGLVANKLMSKYQKPCCVLTRVSRDGKTTYQGSMRGYTRTGVADFSSICTQSSACLDVRGHENAAGLFLDANKIDTFIEDTDRLLHNITDEPVYYVDYQFESDNIDGLVISELAHMNDYIGTGIERPLVFIKNLKITNPKVYDSRTGKILKLSSPSFVDIIKFDYDDENELDLEDESIIINCVCHCNENEYNCQRNPQLIIEDYEVVGRSRENIEDVWGF